MNYPFEKIRDIRKFRKDMSERKLNTEKAVLAKADQILFDKERQLSNHKQQRAQKEKTLYGAITEKPLSFSEFNHFQQHLDYMREIEHDHIQQVQKAEKKKQNAETKVIEALHVFNLRHKENIKIDEHRLEWIKAAVKEEDLKLENEMDEIAQVSDSFKKTNE